MLSGFECTILNVFVVTFSCAESSKQNILPYMSNKNANLKIKWGVCFFICILESTFLSPSIVAKVCRAKSEKSWANPLLGGGLGEVSVI